MSLWQKRGWFWADFSVNGIRFRVPLKDTKGRRIPADEAHREMAARAEERAKQKAERGELVSETRKRGRLAFSVAADEYLASRRGELAPLSMVKETALVARLKEYFGITRLAKIKPQTILAYREWRKAHRHGPGGKQATETLPEVGPALINMEIGCLRRILKWAKLWHLVGAEIKPLKEPETIGRALTHEERTRLFRVAAEKPEWETAYLAGVLAVNTTARGCELRGLRWRNVDFINRTLEIPKSKTEAGTGRVIPLTPEAYDALLKLRRRAEGLGPVEPSHYVFAAFKPRWEVANDAEGKLRPRRMVMTEFDPTRPQGSWRTAWRTLTRKAGLPGLRFHDLRHTAISILGEGGVPDRVIMDIAGHVSPRMLKRYSHIQLETKRAAIQALSNRPQVSPSDGATPRADVTKYVTKTGETEGLPRQVIENNGRPERTRTVDLYRVKVAL
jgi:integrase